MSQISREQINSLIKGTEKLDILLKKVKLDAYVSSYVKIISGEIKNLNRKGKTLKYLGKNRKMSSG